MKELKELVTKSINEDLDSTGYSPALEEYITKNFEENYGISSKDVKSESFPESLLLEEINQHLVDLGFMSNELFNQNQLDTSFILKELETPLNNYLIVDERLRKSLPTKYTTLDFLPIINQRLRHLTSLSGDYILEDEIVLGQASSLNTRVLHYRLKALGLFFEDISIPINKQSMIAARKVGLLTGLDTLNTLKDKWYKPLNINGDNLILEGNIFKVLKTISNFSKDNFLVTKNSQADINIASPDFVYTNNHYLIYGNNEKDFKEAVDRFRLSGNWRPDDSGSIHPSFKLKKIDIDGKLYDEANRFKLELLQILLWVTGYYQGRTDGIWGDISTNALFNFMEQEELDKHQIYLPLTDGNCIINLDKLIPVLLEYNPVNAEQIEQHFYETIDGVTSQDEIIKKEKGFFKKLFENAKKIGRRVYYGVKTLINSASKALNKVWQFLKNKVFGPVISFFKHLYNQIKEGVSYFISGFQKFLHFVLRKPIVTTLNENSYDCFLITKYDFDADSTNFSNNPSVQIATIHQRTISDIIDNYQYFLEVIVKTINFIVAVATFNWIKLALVIGRLVTDFIKSLIKGEPIKLKLAI